MAGGIPISTTTVAGGFLTGRALIYPLSLVISLFFLWGFSYGLLDVLNKHFQDVLKISKVQSTGLQIVYFGGGYLLFSPIAAEVMKRKGYKVTILMGLTLYSLGAILFWPTAHFTTPTNRLTSFAGFCICTLIIASGLATLETSANSYAVVIGDPATASARLQFCQSWNGVASFIGPLIASKYFFSGENSNNLTNVQFVYLAVAIAGGAVAVMFAFSKLPEVSEEMLGGGSGDRGGEEIGSGDGDVDDIGPLSQQYNMIFGFLAQFSYVGAQVTIASFFINYATEISKNPYASHTASNLLSYALIAFTVGRFAATALATVFDSAFLMVIYAGIAIALNAGVVAADDRAGVGVLIALFFFEAPMYPTLFTLGTANLGRHTRRGAGILVMAVSGGAVFPPIQGAIADSVSTRVSYIVPMIGFIYVLGYVTFHFVSHGCRVLRVKSIEVNDTMPSLQNTEEYKLKEIQVENVEYGGRSRDS